MTVPTSQRTSLALDVLRVGALLRVVTLHFSGEDWLTALPALAVMFWASGMLATESRARRGRTSFSIRRYRRVLVPLSVYASVVVIIGLLVAGPDEFGARSVLGTYLPFSSLVDSGVSANGRGGWFMGINSLWAHLWYVGAHLVAIALVAILPPVPWAGATAGETKSNRGPKGWTIGASLFVMSMIALLTDLAVRNGSADNTPHRWGAVAVYLGFFICGYVMGAPSAWALPARFVGSTSNFVLIAGLIVAALAMSLLAVFANDVWPSTVLVASGSAWVCLAALATPIIDMWTPPRQIRRALNWFAERMMTIYLWHMAALYLAVQTLRVLGSAVEGPAGTAVQSLIALALLAPLTVAFSPVERNWSAQRIVALRSSSQNA